MKLVVVDADGTLWHPRYNPLALAMVAAVIDVVERRGGAGAVREFLTRVASETGGRAPLIDRAIIAVLARGDAREREEMLAELYRERRSELVRAYEALTPAEGAREVLEAARSKGYRIAVVSNAPRKVVETMLDATGLSDLADVVIGLWDAPEPKPSPLPFLLAKLECNASEIVFAVGDNLLDDCIGALAAGARRAYLYAPGARVSELANGRIVVAPSWRTIGEREGLL